MADKSVHHSSAASRQSTSPWIFDREELESLGIAEYTNRFLMITFIHDLGKQLQLPHSIITTAFAFTHRFYCRESFLSFDYKKIGITCLFLAAKVEEHPKRLESILTSVKELENISYDRQEILDLELVVLHILCFDLSVDTPYRYVMRYAHQSIALEGGHSHEELAQTAWTLVNESYKGTICLSYHSKVIAFVVLNMAAEKLGNATYSTHICNMAKDLGLLEKMIECQKELEACLSFNVSQVKV